MRRFLSVMAVLTITAPALASDVGVSVSVGQPGYGRIDIGPLPPPRLVYTEPIVAIQRMAMVRQPIYLHVPPGHAKNWRNHCGRYNACSQPVYFVQENWYNNVYVAHYRDGGYAVAGAPVALAARTNAYRQPAQERLYEVPVATVRAVIGPPEQRCWVERQQVVEDRNDGANVPGAIVGAVVGGVLGHQIGRASCRERVCLGV